MYTVRNFKTKKDLKQAVQAHADGQGEPVRIYQPGPFGADSRTYTGTYSVEGPHYPEPHRWYATVTAEAGIVKKVR